MNPHLHVACAIIEHDGLVFAAQRGAAMSLPLLWEFPGGKLESGETAEQALIREVHEELGISVTITKALSSSSHSYPDFTVTLYPFTCRWSGGAITLHEHNAMLWLNPEQMRGLDWAAADRPIICEYLSLTDPAITPASP
ncbi:MAG: (deoxy)nucleoside triphosphate pyrophosphohydrolase [Deltaproteobacteria bacterium]|jgi:8-oxo-dGTP diphosphatase|nr:(deoxy)nucleoside triphosphate pyrophosphohydrolase [Deltaproteobacteria bacterium]